MALKVLQPQKLKHHTVRFSNDDLPRYKSLEQTESSFEYLSSQSFSGADSGAPSPDIIYLPATQRLKLNDQRIKLLTAINQVVQQRAELESNRLTLSSLLDELRRKLKRRVEDCHLEKKDKMKALKLANQRLEKEKYSVTTEIGHLKRHLEKEEARHVQHARTAVAQAIQGVTKSELFAPCSVSQLPDIVCRSVAKNAPSKVADYKITAARLMRDIVDLRQRLAQVEARLTNELKRKRQVENDIVRLRKELSASKSNIASLRLLPIPQKPCVKFA